MLAALSLLVIGGTDDTRTATLLSDEPLARLSMDVRREMPSVLGGSVDALRASWWVAGVMQPDSVEAVAGVSGGLLEVARERNGSIYDAPGAAVLRGVEAIICSWACFRQGFQDFDGNPEWEDRFVDVLLCEGDYWVGYSGPPVSRYISRAQFDPGSWATATAATELSDPDNPYHVGANMAWWSGAISHPGDSSGWPGCWRRGAGL